MNTLVTDFETYFDKKYSLKKMRTIDYVRDARFQVHGASVILNDEAPQWLRPAELKSLLATLNPSNTTVIAHNTYFDGLVLTHHFGFEGCIWYDTLQLARAILPGGHGINLNLDWLSRYFGRAGKVHAQALDDLCGVVDPTPEQLKNLGVYAIDDALDCKFLWDKLSPYMTAQELYLMHMTIRMGVEPRLLLNVPMLEEAKEDAINETQKLIQASGYQKKQLTSQPQFAAILESHGVDIPTKVSPTTGEDIPALGKNDLEFKTLYAHHPELKHIFDGRIAAKSNIVEKRALAMLEATQNGVMCFPMPLKYVGAHTWRWSGNDGLNVQNFVRGSKLRLSIEAPEGFMVGVLDLSGIELRVNAWLSDETWMLDAIKDGKDLYAVYAEKHFGYPVGKDSDERQYGKMVELACLGGDTLVLTPNGWIPIKNLDTSSPVWDGIEWVCHEGLINKGVKETCHINGIQITKTHGVLCGKKWISAISVAQNANILSRALETGSENLPYQGLLWENEVDASTPSKQKLPVYDLLNAGPRNRFTVLTSKGPLIVHNCGFGMGADKFQYNAAVGFMGCPPIALTDDEAYRAIHAYRAVHSKIKGFWDHNQKMLSKMLFENCDIEYKGIHYMYESVHFPNGTALTYPNLHVSEDGDWSYGYDNRQKKIYGGLFSENVVQKFARDILADQMHKIDLLPDVRMVSCTHDEVIFLAPTEVMPERFEQAKAIMETEISWAPGLPLNAEGGFAHNYSK